MRPVGVRGLLSHTTYMSSHDNQMGLDAIKKILNFQINSEIRTTNISRCCHLFLKRRNGYGKPLSMRVENM